MAVDLSEMIDVVKRETSPPGTDLFPASTDDEWLGHVSDAFWEAKLIGMPFDAYTETDGTVTVITPSPSTPEFPRDFQQIVVLVAGYRIIRNYLMNVKTSFHAESSGNVYEVEQSAQLLREVLLDIRRKLDFVMTRLSDLGRTKTYYMDALIARDESLIVGDTYYVNGPGIPQGFGYNDALQGF